MRLFRLLSQGWKSLSIAKKLYAVVGIMAILIAGELITLHYAMETLSAVRAFVGGEGLWSKAQKNAAFNLQRYATTRDEDDYQDFLQSFQVPDGDHLARTELYKKNPDLSIVRRGFLQGNVHPDDITPMINLLLRFHQISYLKRALELWAEGDQLLQQFKEAGIDYHRLLTSGISSKEQIEEKQNLIRELNHKLTLVEDDFSHVLGKGSRWLERVIISLLIIAVLAVESIGLGLTFATSRSISRGLKEISTAAKAIGIGYFSRVASVPNTDEIGQLAASVNQMGGMLERSYSELEQRVQERTAELEKAVRTRDEFLSVASHELKTPLTVIKLQLEMRKRYLQKKGIEHFTPEVIKKMVESDEKQISGLVHLVDDMLDVARLDTGKFKLNVVSMDLCKLVRETMDKFAPLFANANCEVSLSCEGQIVGQWDSYRVEQALSNLLTNALKYGSGKPIHVSVSLDQKYAYVSVKDSGIGIAPADQSRIFQRFERVALSHHFGGLGLGLFITKQIMEAHQGEIKLKSEAGQGSEFILNLPMNLG